ncbi:hypothetical protein MMF93_17265 [Streptomyces tubbatahanensis]|uniref:Uncharacterized protein n=1 Tax=Streptomyces tubbatahanensis TaxID=2923272 RepID=A0ABY3XU64_9ACTN|nr:hypothetical protein [Streptomyces tubbatahanensis]UNS98024.1 hypothetical protein MMF93_17265 [Streptomyces tubbatahanensis]
MRLQSLRADGRIQLRGAQVDDLVSLQSAELTGSGASVVCVGMRAEALDLRFARPPTGGVNLRDAHASRLQDNPRTWPSTLGLDGLTYD